MHRWLLVLLLVAPLAAQPMDDLSRINQDHAVKLAFGDIPLTTAVEPAGAWNGVAYAKGAAATFVLPNGAAYDGTDCSCANFTVSRTGDRFELTTNASATFAFRFHFPALTALAFSVPGQSTATQIIVYAQDGFAVTSNLVRQGEALPTTDGTRFIHSFELPAGGNAAWFTVHPSITTVAPAKSPDYLMLAAGIILGALVWAMLVGRGLVQKRSRKQVVATAAHVEAAKTEPRPVLEARKRVLVAALKELELAKQENQVDTPTYDVVKADLKKQAVTAMRALEESKA